MFENLLLKKEGNIAILSINKPKSLNALDTSVLKELERAVDLLELDSEVDVVIITGEGKAFVAGADISEMKNKTTEEARIFGEFGSKVFRKIELMSKPTIAAINGFALGGGCELAMCCDIRIAGEKAKFGQPEVGLGIIPGFAGTQRVSRLIGTAKAKELIFTGDIIDMTEAKNIGLVNKIVLQEDLLQETLELAKRISKNSQVAVRYAKMAINRGINCDIDTANHIESNLFGLCFATEDQKEGMQAFLEKRKPVFTNK